MKTALRPWRVPGDHDINKIAVLCSPKTFDKENLFLRLKRTKRDSCGMYNNETVELRISKFLLYSTHSSLGIFPSHAATDWYYLCYMGLSPLFYTIIESALVNLDTYFKFYFASFLSIISILSKPSLDQVDRSTLIAKHDSSYKRFGMFKFHTGVTVFADQFYGGATH